MAWNGHLNSNEVFSVFYNMVMSQTTQTESLDGLEEDGLLEKNRVDGGLYGDTKLFYDADVLRSFPWGADADGNLLKQHRPTNPKTQNIVLNKFRQVPITVDYYLSKRAWMNEGAFNEFMNVMLGWVRGTKRVYDYTTFYTHLCTDESSIGKQNDTITLPTVANDIEKQNRLEGMAIAEYLANLFIEIKKPSRVYNDNEFLKARSMKGLAVVWNAKAVNKIEKYVLPVLFHKEGFIDKFAQYIVPAEYFGKRNASGGTAASPNKNVRSLIEIDYNPADKSMNASDYDPKLHIFPGDLIPAGQKYEANTTYTQDDTILFKVVDEHCMPYMSAFEVGTSFFNAQSLNENQYLTWGHNTLVHRKDMPFITIRGVQGA